MQIIKALLCQVLAGILTLLIHHYLKTRIGDFNVFILLQGFLAAGFSMLLKQAVWWRIIHLLFLPIVAMLLVVNLPSWIYLLSFVMFTLIFWGTVKGDVPLFLSSTPVSNALLHIIAKEKTARFADLGAGIGTIIMPIAKQYPTLTITAWEHAPLPWLLTYWRCRRFTHVKVRFDSLWKANLAEYSIVFAFLSPVVMAKLAEKIHREMCPGSLFISSSFPLPDRLPESTIEINDPQHTRLYCYRIHHSQSD